MLRLKSKTPASLNSYNSALYSTTLTNEYLALEVSQGFLQNHPFNTTKAAIGLGGAAVAFPFDKDIADIALELQSKALSGRLLNMSLDDCVSAYASSIMTQYSNAVVVTDRDDNADSGSILELTFQVHTPKKSNFETIRDPYECISQASPNQADPKWYHLGFKGPNPTFQYCLIQEIDTVCTIELSTAIMILIIACNCAQLSSFLLILWKKSRSTLVTLGDAISSFLQQPSMTSPLLGPISDNDAKFLGQLK